MPAPSAERAWHTCTPSWPVLVHGHTREGIDPIRKSQTKKPGSCRRPGFRGSEMDPWNVRTSVG
jgi:hypothetical protein